MLGSQADTTGLLEGLVARAGADPATATRTHAPYRETKRHLAELGDELAEPSQGPPAAQGAAVLVGDRAGGAAHAGHGAVVALTALPATVPWHGAFEAGTGMFGPEVGEVVAGGHGADRGAG
jgi:hypothetical protein